MKYLIENLPVDTTIFHGHAWWLLPFMVIQTIVVISILATRGGTGCKLPFPPGPKPLPVIGNLFHMPMVRPWLTFFRWRELYGDVVHLQIFGRHILVVNSLKAANDLLEKRSRIFSDRPRLSLHDFLGGGFSIPMMSYGDIWRKHRSILQQKLHANEVKAFHAIETAKAHVMVWQFIDSPAEFRAHIKAYIAGVTMHVAYGYEPVEGTDPIIELVDEMTHMFTECVLKASLMESFPKLQSVLEWFPGVNHQKSGEEGRELVRKVLDLPFEFVKRTMTNGTAKSSFTLEQLEITASLTDRAEIEEQEQFIKNVAGNIYSAGTDTTDAALNSFLQAMVLYPAAQKKAQEEIDRVIGLERLPNFGDRSSLPFVEALYREVLRYRPVTPMGVPHAATEDVSYNGYFIPKGTVVLANIWSMTHDENIYHSPNKFLPERFLKPDGQLNDDSVPLTFGFGRRICVGRLLAEDMLWIAIALTLSTCDLGYAKNKGNTIEIDEVYPDNLISIPRPFKCSITPRSEDRLRLMHMIDHKV